MQRKLLDAHLKQCFKSVESVEKPNGNAQTEPDSELIINAEPSLIAKKNHLNELEERLMILETDLNAVRAALNEETRQRHRLIVDVGFVRKHNVISDEWTQKVGEVLASLKKCVNEETESRCIDVQQAKVDIGRLILQYQVSAVELQIFSSGKCSIYHRK